MSQKTLFDPKEAKRLFAKKGFLHLRGALDPRFLEAILFLMLDEGSQFQDSDDQTLGGKYPILRLSEQLIFQIAGRLQATNALKELLGDTLFVRNPIMRYVPPNSQHALALNHQDAYGRDSNTNFVTAWIPLVAIDGKCGGIGLYPSLGYDRLFPTEEKTTGVASINVGDAEPVTMGHMAVGDVLIFHPFMVHGSQPNTSDRIRMSVDMRIFSTQEGLPSPYFDMQKWESVLA